MSAPVAIAASSPRTVGLATTTLAGSAAPVTSDNLALGAVQSSQSRTVEVWLAGRQRAAQRFVDAVSTPGSATYHRYISPVGYSERFGPRAAQVKAVRSFLVRAGFTGVHASVNHDYVSATAPVWRIGRAFSVQMRRYRITAPKGGSATIQANDRDLSVPTSIRGDILAVTGLDSVRPEAAGTAATPTAKRVSAPSSGCSRYWAQKTKTFTPAFDGITKAAVAVCGYSASQIRDGYGLGSVKGGHTPTGAGTTIALIQVGAPVEMFTALTDYAQVNGLPRPRRDQYRQEAAAGSSKRPCDSQTGTSSEASLDSEAAYAMAPGADQLMVDGNGCDAKEDGDQALFDAELAPLTGHGSRPSAGIESVSYFLGPEKSVSPALRTIGHAIALRAAAEGVSLLLCSGDSQGIQLQAADPDVTAVGGTTLGVGAHGQRVFETGWSDDIARRKGTSGPWHDEGIPFAAGGGTSNVYGQPAYQQAVVPRSLARNRAGTPGRAVPDLAADSDPQSGMLVGVIGTRPDGKATPYMPFTSYGTSQSTPLVAGMIADAEQGQSKRFGFLNPLLYSLSGTRAFHDILPESPADPQVDRAAYTTLSIITHRPLSPLVWVFDDQDPSLTDQVTAPGYDTMTGLGTPNGFAFIKALRSGG